MNYSDKKNNKGVFLFFFVFLLLLSTPSYLWWNHLNVQKRFCYGFRILGLSQWGTKREWKTSPFLFKHSEHLCLQRLFSLPSFKNVSIRVDWGMVQRYGNCDPCYCTSGEKARGQRLRNLAPWIPVALSSDTSSTRNSSNTSAQSRKE